MEKQWLIWSIEHKAWWGPNCIGYRQKKKEAGRYPYKQALKIVQSANQYCKEVPNEAMIAEEEMQQCSNCKQLVDHIEISLCEVCANEPDMG